MMTPRLGSGANTAERGPSAIATSPRRIFRHALARSPGDSAECSTATLPGNRDEKRAAKVDPTHGPKLVRCAEEVLRTTDRTCLAAKHYCLDSGHIIFCDNMAVHYWMRTLPLAAGVHSEGDD